MPEPTHPDDLRLYCPNCGYNVTGLSTQRCPECGKEFDLDKLREPSPAERAWLQFGAKGIVWVLLAPGLCVAGYIALNLSGALLGDETLGMLLFLGLILLSLPVAFIGSFNRGRWIARRMARRDPGDPATPVTVLMTLVYGSVSFLFQLAMIFFVLAKICSFPTGH